MTLSLFNTLKSIAKSCSVKAKGHYFSKFSWPKVITNCNHLGSFFLAKLKHELTKESFGISFDRMVKNTCFDAIL